MENEIKNNEFILVEEFERFYLGINSLGIRECFHKFDYYVDDTGFIKRFQKKQVY